MQARRLGHPFHTPLHIFHLCLSSSLSVFRPGRLSVYRSPRLYDRSARQRCRGGVFLRQKSPRPHGEFTQNRYCPSSCRRYSSAGETKGKMPADLPKQPPIFHFHGKSLHAPPQNLPNATAQCSQSENRTPAWRIISQNTHP